MSSSSHPLSMQRSLSPRILSEEVFSLSPLIQSNCWWLFQAFYNRQNLKGVALESFCFFNLLRILFASNKNTCHILKRFECLIFQYLTELMPDKCTIHLSFWRNGWYKYCQLGATRFFWRGRIYIDFFFSGIWSTGLQALYLKKGLPLGFGLFLH